VEGEVGVQASSGETGRQRENRAQWHGASFPLVMPLASRAWLWPANVLVPPLVDASDLLDPSLPFAVFHPHDLVVGPVQVVGEVRSLFAQPRRGVARPPPRLAVSTSKSPWQCGQVTASRVCPCSFRRR